MKTYLSTLIFILVCGFAKSQTKVTAKEVVNYVGKEVTLCDSVYSATALESISFLNIGGQFPKEIITMVVFKSDRAKFKKEPVELYGNKRICVTGRVTLYKDKLQLVVNDPKHVRTE